MSDKPATAAYSSHPMVAVPEAIRIVLRETARRLVAEEPRGEQVMAAAKHSASLVHQVLAEDVVMQEPGYPPYRASIMDGYCIRSNEAFQQVGPDTTHYVVDKVFAGDHQGLAIRQDAREATTSQNERIPTAYYVTTGAMVPESFDCVVPIEEVIVQQADSNSHQIVIQKVPAKVDKWIRPVGCDIAPGSIVLPAGHVLDPAALGLLTQSGSHELRLRRRVPVGVLSTGNELLVGDGGAWKPQTDGVHGKIPDVNRPILCSLLQNLGDCQVHDLGSCRDDDPAAMAQVLRAALETCEVIVTTGGISMGETDIVEDVLVQELGGTLHFGRIHMKPGKPSTFVTIPPCTVSNNTRFIFALPGNPVSAVVCTHLLVRPCLALLYEGVDDSTDTYGDSVDECIRRTIDNATLAPPDLLVQLAHDIPLDTERPEYHRVTLQLDEVNKIWIAISTGLQRSSRLMSLRDADALLALPQASDQKPQALAGESLPAVLLKTERSPKMTVSQSRHLNKKWQRSFRVGIVQYGRFLFTNVRERVEKALSGSKCGDMVVSSTRIFEGSPDQLYDFVAKGGQADFHIVVGSSQRGSFSSNAAVSACLKSRLVKVADGIALQVRRCAAADSPLAALFESVVGLIEGNQKSLLVFVSPDGLDGGLSNVRGLIKHALEIARGTKHLH